MNVKRLLAGIAFAGALASAACGGGDNSAPATSTALSTAPARATAQPTTAASTPTQAAATATTAALVVTATNPPPSPAATTPPTPAPAATTPPAPTTAPLPPAVTSVTVTAENSTFDRSSIRVKAGTRFTANFVNKDAGISHNLGFSLPGLDHETCLGPCTTTQTFTPARPGTFSFFCTLHAEMFGDFIVE